MVINCRFENVTRVAENAATLGLQLCGVQWTEINGETGDGA